QGRRVCCGMAKDVLGVVELGAVEPLCAGHCSVREDVRWQLCQLDAEEVDDRGPERFEVADGPAPQLVVVLEGSVAMGCEPAHVLGHQAALFEGLGRRPQELTFGYGCA